MPVTVRIEDRVKKTDAAAPALADYADPSERSEGLKAFFLWALTLLAVSCVLAAWETTRGIGIGLFVWWLVSAIIYFMLAPRFLLRRLRMHGREYEVNSRTQPRLKTLLGKASTTLGISEPEAFMIQEPVTRVAVLGRKDPHFLIVTQTTCENLENPEIDCLVLRGLVEARQRQTARRMLLHFLDGTQPALRILVWPAVFYGFLLRAFWLEPAEKNADRLTLLLMKNPKLLTSAILKEFVANDEEMQMRSITTEDVDNYIRQGSNISLHGGEISTQYKLGNAIHENGFLEERLQAISSYARSPEFTEATQKLAQSRAAKTPTGFFPAPDASSEPSVQNPPRR
jgi:hypothetical protein